MDAVDQTQVIMLAQRALYPFLSQPNPTLGFIQGPNGIQRHWLKAAVKCLPDHFTTSGILDLASPDFLSIFFDDFLC